MTRFQCQTLNLKNDSFYYTTDKLSRFTHGTFASMWALPKIEISRNFLPLQTVDLVHLCRELVHKSGQSLRVCVSHFLPQTPHDPTDISRSGIPINSLRKDGPESSMLQKSSHFGPKNKGSVSSYRQSVGVWAGKCSSMNCIWVAVVWWNESFLRFTVWHWNRVIRFLKILALFWKWKSPVVCRKSYIL
jgi:hypothetical protein